MIIGLTGRNASGKGEMADYLVKKGFKYFSLSDEIREEIKAEKLEVTRENLIQMGNKLRFQFGAGILAEKILSKLKPNENYIIDLDMIINGLEKLPNAKLYDYLIMGDVLEHVSKPEILLTYLSQFLKKDGFLIVSPPNVANWMIRLKLLFGQFDYNGGILDTGHLKFFTFKTAKRLLDGCGYEITACANNNTTKLFSFLGRYWKSMFAFQFVFKCVHK